MMADHHHLKRRRQNIQTRSCCCDDGHQQRRQQEQSRQRRRRTHHHHYSLMGSSSPVVLLIVILTLLISLTYNNSSSSTIEALIIGGGHHHLPTTDRKLLRLQQPSKPSVGISSSLFKLYANTPRRTRRIDEILFGDDDDNNNNNDPNNNNNNVEDDECDVSSYNDLTMSVNSLQSTLAAEQQKASTLAVKLANAESVIAEQKKRLETKKKSLAIKDQKLKELEQKFNASFNTNNSKNQPIRPPRPPSLPTTVNKQISTGVTANKETKPTTVFPPVPWQYPPLTSKERQYPLISYWSINTNSDEITGTVTCHPSIPDGTTIVTSSLQWGLTDTNPDDTKSKILNENYNVIYKQEGTPATVVTTQSGSKYQLGEKKIQTQQQSQQQQSQQFRQQSPSQQLGQQSQQQPSSQQRQQPPPPQPVHPSNKLYPNLEYKLTGQSISNGFGTKYLLAGIPKRKPSGRCEIIMAYKADEQSRPILNTGTNSNGSGDIYIVKLSKLKEKLEREYNNYCRVQENNQQPSQQTNNDVTNNNSNDWMGGMTNMLFGDNNNNGSSNSYDSNSFPFVKCYDFLPVCEGSIIYAQHSALILEKGYEDLRDYEYKLQTQNQNQNGQDQNDLTNANTNTKKQELDGIMHPILVQASLLSAAKCLDILHNKARLVYTDLKAENLIFMSSNDQQLSNANINIKGIDLESCISVKGHPLDYTPEACPPEFAIKHLNGQAYDFTLEYSYDIWVSK
jgi:hypothetical protein